MGWAARVTSAAEGLPRRRFTVAEVEAMVAAGVTEEDERVELIGRAVRLTARVYREPTLDGYGEARDAAASDRTIPLVMPDAFALSLGELELE